MDKDFIITIGENNFPQQTFQRKVFTLFPKERYFSRGKHKMHQLVWKHYYGAIPKGFHVHHKNENVWDNRIENLELISANKHLSHHAKKRFENIEFKQSFIAKGIEEAKKWHKSNEGREWHKQHGKDMWKDRNYEEKICEICNETYKTRHKGVTKFCSGKCKAKAIRNRAREVRRSL